MRKYEVIGDSANFSQGRLKLSDEQYAAREHALEKTDEEGVYEIVSKVQFKRGEKLLWDGEPSKILLKDLEPKSKPPDPPKAKDEKPEKKKAEDDKAKDEKPKGE